MKLRSLLVSAAVTALFGVSLPASAENALTVSATRSGGAALVQGTFQFDAVSFPALGTETAGDDVAGGKGLGGDLKGYSMDFNANGDLVVRWTADLPAAPVSGAPGYVYGVVFLVNGTTGYQLDAARVTTHPSATPRGVLWKCTASDCRVDRQTVANDNIATTFDPATGRVTSTIPKSLGIVKAGDILTPVALAGASVFIALGHMGSGQNYSYSPGSDRLNEDWSSYTAGARVDLAVADEGTPLGELEYGTVAKLTGNTYSASVPAAAGQVVYARGCAFDACVYAQSAPLA